MTLDSDRRLPRADRHQDQGGHHRPADDRRRRAQELRAGHRRLRRDPRPRRCRGAQIRGPDHRRRRARRRLLVLDAAGGRRAGARSTPRSSRWCSPRPTSVLPLLASDAYHRGHWKQRAKRSLRQAVRRLRRDHSLRGARCAMRARTARGMFMRTITTLALLAGARSSTACNTVHGVGEDAPLGRPRLLARSRDQQDHEPCDPRRPGSSAASTSSQRLACSGGGCGT